MTRRISDKQTHQYTLPEVDKDKLYRNLYCRTCKETTIHIFCFSIHKVGKTERRPLVYACMECAEENQYV